MTTNEFENAVNNLYTKLNGRNLRMYESVCGYEEATFQLNRNLWPGDFKTLSEFINGQLWLDNSGTIWVRNVL